MDNYKKCNFWHFKKNLGPVHLLTKTNKWDYLWCPIIEKKIVSCFDIGEVPRSPGKWNWNLLYFLPFICTFEQCEINFGPSKAWKLGWKSSSINMMGSFISSCWLISSYFTIYRHSSISVVSISAIFDLTRFIILSYFPPL